jgi:hypothetical protein
MLLPLSSTFKKSFKFRFVLLVLRAILPIMSRKSKKVSLLAEKSVSELIFNITEIFSLL